MRISENALKFGSPEIGSWQRVSGTLPSGQCSWIVRVRSGDGNTQPVYSPAPAPEAQETHTGLWGLRYNPGLNREGIR